MNRNFPYKTFLILSFFSINLFSLSIKIVDPLEDAVSKTQAIEIKESDLTKVDLNSVVPDKSAVDKVWFCQVPVIEDKKKGVDSVELLHLDPADQRLKNALNLETKKGQKVFNYAVANKKLVHVKFTKQACVWKLLGKVFGMVSTGKDKVFMVNINKDKDRFFVSQHSPEGKIAIIWRSCLEKNNISVDSMGAIVKLKLILSIVVALKFINFIDGKSCDLVGRLIEKFIKKVFLEEDSGLLYKNILSKIASPQYIEYLSGLAIFLGIAIPVVSDCFLFHFLFSNLEKRAALKTLIEIQSVVEPEDQSQSFFVPFRDDIWTIFCANDDLVNNKVFKNKDLYSGAGIRTAVSFLSTKLVWPTTMLIATLVALTSEARKYNKNRTAYREADRVGDPDPLPVNEQQAGIVRFLDILGDGFDDRTCTTAYRQRSLGLHPDRNPGKDDAEFKAFRSGFECIRSLGLEGQTVADIRREFLPLSSGDLV